MRTLAKILISGTGASILGLNGLVPADAFRGYDPALVGTLYGVAMGTAGALMIWPWTQKRRRKDVAAVTPPDALPRIVEPAATPRTVAVTVVNWQTRINRRRFQYLISGVICVASAGYGIYKVVPDYNYFATDYEERFLRHAAGMDTFAGWQKHYDHCMKANGQNPNPFAQQPYVKDPARDEVSESCGEPGWIIGGLAPQSGEIPLAFARANGSQMLSYIVLAVLLGPWAIGVVVVRLLPTGIGMLRRWLTTHD